MAGGVVVPSGLVIVAECILARHSGGQFGAVILHSGGFPLFGHLSASLKA